MQTINSILRNKPSDRKHPQFAEPIHLCYSFIRNLITVTDNGSKQ